MLKYSKIKVCLSFSRSQFVMKKSSNDTFFRSKRGLNYSLFNPNRTLDWNVPDQQGMNSHFFTNYILIFHKTEVQTVVLRRLMGLNYNWFKSYDINRKKLVPEPSGSLGPVLSRPVLGPSLDFPGWESPAGKPSRHPIFFWFTLWNPGFFLVAILKKFRLNSTIFFSGWQKHPSF